MFNYRCLIKVFNYLLAISCEVDSQEKKKEKKTRKWQEVALERKVVSHAGTCKGTYISAHNPPFHSVWWYDLATSQQWKLPCVTTKKELPSSLINFLYWADLDTHTYDVCLYSCQWYEGKTGSAATDVLLDLCVYLSFVLLSPASPLKFDWCPVIYSFHLVCLLSLSLYACVSVII